MNYKILIPCFIVGLLFIAGIYFFINDETIETSTEIITEEKSEDTNNEIPNRTISVDIKEIEGCNPGVIKCDINGCREQC